MPKIILYAKKDCPQCNGTGVVYNIVPMPFGIGTTREPLSCDCAFIDLDDETMDKVEETGDFEIRPAEEGAEGENV